jgi:pyruvate,water dikinase
MIEQWTVHGLINFVVVAGARFCDFYDECFEPQDRTEAYQCLQGFVTRSVDASRGLWQLSRLVRAQPALRALWDRLSPAEVHAALPDAPGGPAFLDELGRYLDEFGWRSDAVYDVADVTWREDPQVPLAALGGYLALDDSHDPEARFADAVRRREELLANARRRLADQPERLARFDALYEAARHNNPITEDHAFWIDQCGIANFRRFLLQVGERLVSEGVVEGADDVFFLTVAEVIGGLERGGDRRAEAAARRAEVVRAAELSPPRTLGRPPAPSGRLDPLLDALGVRLSGRRPPDPEAPVPGELRGVGASAGTANGTARVVRSLAEASKLSPGDVMVCEMTLPPWVPLFSLVSAVVADTGGIMSHCAIVAREYGVPAVVGTLVGTTTIADGSTVTVDGDRGIVRADIVGTDAAPLILDLR